MARRIRSIKPEFFSDQLLGKLPIETHFLAIGLISISDDEGWFNANPSYIMAEVFPLRIFDDPSPNVPRMLHELSSIEFVKLYRDDRGSEFGVVDGFVRHQKVDKPKPSTISQRFGEFTPISLIETNRRHVVDASTTRRGSITVGLEGIGMDRIGMDRNGMDTTLTTFGGSGLKDFSSDINQKPKTVNDTAREAGRNDNGIEQRTNGHDRDGHQRGSGDDCHGNHHARVAEDGDPATQAAEQQARGREQAPQGNHQGTSLPLRTASEALVAAGNLGNCRDDNGGSALDRKKLPESGKGAQMALLAHETHDPTQTITGTTKVAETRAGGAKALRIFGKTAMEMEYPDAYQVWQAAPAMARGRSSTIQLMKSWREQQKNGGIPPVAEVLESLEHWKRSKKWAENGGEYIEGLHRWVSCRQWENRPLSAMEMANEQFASIDAMFGGPHG